MSSVRSLTKRLRGIRAAWHLWYAVGFGGESGLRKLGLCGIHPLTQRYALFKSLLTWSKILKVFMIVLRPKVTMFFL
ncbi:DUF3265 domain-containing protein [Vibrio vulnificus]|nr:DUF3265 domain-containing protein [Vibrio vulnificus]MBN8133768.1 DUF3265 domain-containing protein [Vibrio vulnificus]MBN8138270.1 DUF3265 domain-containing protein [Vibrio vulnificus]MBN8161380.1 DUF3265 domain-containing protein [Vibrio vulnificus]HAS6073949.1 DUF3265 domain-containing protein [Vibrio vulnificus]